MTDSLSQAGNAGWTARSLAHVWHPCTQMKQHETFPLVPIVRGSGLWLHDADGRRYLDGISSWWVNLFGHAHPAINAAVKEQLDTLEHVMLAGFTHPPVVELSERLTALTGGALGHCFYASDGASAVEIALKMSFHFWRNSGQPQRQEFVALRHGYHGETIGALAVTDVEIFRDAYDPLLRPAHVVMSPDARQATEGETAADVAARAAADLERVLEERAGRIAAVIVEPLIQCAAGMAMYDPAYLRLVRGLCDQHGVHLICDEIAVGCGRTGTFFATEQAAEGEGDAVPWPDFLCLSKGISGGYLPLSLVMCTDTVYAAFYDDRVARGFLHSHSYTGNPLACRAAVATLDLFARDDVLVRNRRTAQRLGEALASLATHPQARHVRQRGMVWACDAVTDDPQFARRFFARALERELLVRPIGNTVYLMPPYILRDADIDFLAERLIKTFDEVVHGPV